MTVRNGAADLHEKGMCESTGEQAVLAQDWNFDSKLRFAKQPFTRHARSKQKTHLTEDVFGFRFFEARTAVSFLNVVIEIANIPTAVFCVYVSRSLWVMRKGRLQKQSFPNQRL